MLKRNSLIPFLFMWTFTLFPGKVPAEPLDSLKQLLLPMLHAQPIDSLEVLDVYLQLGKVYTVEEQFDSAIAIFERALLLSPDNFTRASIHHEMGFCYQLSNDVPQAHAHNLAASQAANEEVPLKLRAGIFHQLAQLYVNQHHPDSALRNEFLALGFAERSGDKLILGKIYGGLARIYYSADFKKKALTYDLKAMDIKLKIGDTRDWYRAYADVASSYLELGNYDSTLYFAQLAQEAANEAEFTHGMAFSCLLLGEAYKRMDRLDTAQVMLEDAYRKYRELKRFYHMADVLAALGDIKVSQELHQTAIDTFHAALSIAEQISYNAMRIALSQKLSTSYTALGQLEKAKAYEADYSRLQAEFESDTKDSLQVMEMKFLMAKAEMESLELRMQLDRELQASQQALRVQKLRQTIMWLGLFLLAILLVFIHSRYRLYKERNQALTIEKEETDMSLNWKENALREWQHLSEQIFSEIHGELKAIRQRYFIHDTPEVDSLSELQMASLKSGLGGIDDSLTQLRHFMDVGKQVDLVERKESQSHKSEQKLTTQQLIDESKQLLKEEQQERLDVSLHELDSFMGNRQKFVLLFQQALLFILECNPTGLIKSSIRGSFDKEAGSYEMDYVFVFDFPNDRPLLPLRDNWHLAICERVLTLYGGRLWLNEGEKGKEKLYFAIPWEQVRNE